MNDVHLQVLRDLLTTPTAPFAEQGMIAAIENLARSHGLRFERDNWGNVWIEAKEAGEKGPGWIFQAHLDHPGFVVCESSGRGVEATFRGSVGQEYFADAPVRFFPEGAKPVRATVSRAKPDRDRGPFPLYRLELEARADLPPGTIGMWDLPAFRRRTTRLYSRACDDLVGTAGVFCALLESVRAGAAHVRVLLTRGEEAGFVGALAACQAGSICPDATLVSVETSREMPGAPLGGGVVIRVGDRASVFDPAVTDHLARRASQLAREDESFAFARQLMPGGVCESTVFCAYGLRAGALCLPLGNYHNMAGGGRIGPERIDLRDFASLVKLLKAVASEAPAFRAEPPILDRLRELLAQREGYLQDAPAGRSGVEETGVAL